MHNYRYREDINGFHLSTTEKGFLVHSPGMNTLILALASALFSDFEFFLPVLSLLVLLEVVIGAPITMWCSSLLYTVEPTVISGPTRPVSSTSLGLILRRFSIFSVQMSGVFAAAWLRKTDTPRMERKVNFMMGVSLYRISDERDIQKICLMLFYD